MVDDGTHETISVNLSPDVIDWLDERAEATDADREELVANLMSAYRSVAVGNGDLEGAVEPVASSPTFERRLDEQREEYIELIEDIRERVIQVKRETDAKAPTDHDHPTVVSRADEAAAAVEDLESRIDEVEHDLEHGFENYEDVLTYLTDSTEDVETNLDTLARAVLDLRSALQRVAAESAARVQADRLKTQANKHGFHRADCEECGSTVDLSLLSKASCPHCSATFVDVDQKTGFFGSNKLLTGSAPALEGGVEDQTAEDLAAIVEEDVGEDDIPQEFEWQERDGDSDQ